MGHSDMYLSNSFMAFHLHLSWNLVKNIP